MKAIFILLLLGGLGSGGYYFWQQQQVAAAKSEAPTHTPAKVERGPLKLTVAATGRVVSNLDVDIKCKASGTIRKLPFDVSDAVKQGELLVELDPVDEQRAVALSTVAVSSSEARLAEAKQNLLIAEQKIITDRMRASAAVKSSDAKVKRARIKADRLKIALASSAATQEEYDTAETEAVQAGAELQISHAQVEEIKLAEATLEIRRQDVILAEEEVKADRITLDNAKQRLIETKVIAPMDGVVAVRNVQIGQIIASAISNVAGGTTVLTLSDLSHVYVLASVDESDIGSVLVDQPVIVTADAFSGKMFKGKVVRIATRGTNVSNVVTFEVKIEILSPNKALLKPEMTANIEVIVAEKDSVLLVPNEAISRKRGESYVNVEVPGTPEGEERKVSIGVSDRIKTEIVEGLAEGETVLMRKGAAESRWRGQGQGGQRPFNPSNVMGGGRR